MSFKSFLLSGLLVAIMGLLAVGCNDNPTDPDPIIPAAPTGAMAVSKNATTVGLSWTASTTTDVTYMVAWEDASMNGGSKDGITGTTTDVDNLTAGTEYTFTITAISTDGSESTTSATVKWAAANRYVQDQGMPTETIKLYEFASANGSVLVMSTANGGPKVVSAASYNPANQIELGIYLGAGNTFVAGPAFSLIEFGRADEFNQNFYVSNESYAAPSLDAWYLSQPISDFIPNDGNTIVYENLPAKRTDNMGIGFFFRRGGSTQNFGRAFIVPDANGDLIRGTAPNRYVEIQISYQTTPGVAYAKGATAPTVAYTATKRR